MPRPSNIQKIFDDLLYEPKILREANWNIHRSKDFVLVRATTNHPLYGKIAYGFKCGSPGSVWLRISQYSAKQNIKDQEILNIPLSWLPEGYREDFELLLCMCLFVEPTKLVADKEQESELPVG